MKRLGQDRGYMAVIEQPILDGVGKVDVSLEKGERKIACEISVTSTAEYELGNIQKCVAAGYETVVLLSNDSKTLSRIKRKAEAELEPTTCQRLRFLQPDEFIGFLNELAAAEAGGEKTVRGYRVKTSFTPLDESDAEARKRAIAQVLLQGMRRLKE